jgi:hypothetical protein
MTIILLDALVGVIVAVIPVSIHTSVVVVVTAVDVNPFTTCNTEPVGNLALPKVPLEMLDALVAVDACVVASLNVRPFVPSTTNVIQYP